MIILKDFNLISCYRYIMNENEDSQNESETRDSTLSNESTGKILF